MWRVIQTALALALLAGCQADGGGSGTCSVTQAATYQLVRQRTLLFVPVTIQGTDVLMLMDTGAETSAIASELLGKLGLLADPRHGTLMSGVGGSGLGESDVLVDHLNFAGLEAESDHFAVLNVALPTGRETPFGGILGADMLSHFDLDLDVAHDRLTVYRVRHCSGRFLPWTIPYASIPLEGTWGGRLLLPVSVDGVTLRALLDTGASASIIDSAAAARLGVTAEVLSHEPSARGFGAAGVDFTHTQHRFRSLQVGPRRFDNLKLTVLDRTLREADMLLGEDFLAKSHVWISYRSHQLFVATDQP